MQLYNKKCVCKSICANLNKLIRVTSYENYVLVLQGTRFSKILVNVTVSKDSSSSYLSREKSSPLFWTNAYAFFEFMELSCKIMKLALEN